MNNFVLRNTPKIADCFVFETCADNNGLDCYEISAKDGKIVISANNNIAKAMGYYRYLSEYCNVLIVNGEYNISYIKSAPLPTETIRYTVGQKLRLAMTYERFAAEADAWGFDRWEKEIDFMAMMGVNSPLAVVSSDAVLYKMLTEMRIKQASAQQFISGSNFWTRQLQGNIFGYLPVGEEEYFNKKIDLGRRITQREKELDMNPIHQGFIPTVPFSFRRHFPKTKLIKLPLWNLFAPPMTISPNDYGYYELFAKMYLKKQRELLGEVHNYIFDPLSDIDFKGYTSYVNDAAESFLSALKEFDKDAVWFVHSKSLCNLKKRLDSTVIIDEDGTDAFKHNGFGGTDFVSGIKGNLFGRTVICGDMETALQNPYLQAKKQFDNAVGSGLFFDSDFENLMFYSLGAKMLTADGEGDMIKFLTRYSKCRYGTGEFTEDLLKLQKLCYGKNSALNQASALCMRPCTEISHTAPFDTFERPYENKELLALIKDCMSKDLKKNDNFRKDFQSLLRQVLSNSLFPIYELINKCFFAQKVEDFEKLTNAFIEIVTDIDRLLKTVESTNLYHHIELARQIGDTKDMSQSLEVNFLMYHTVYGPSKNSQLYDIAWREWGGMVKDFYLMRWYKYFKMMAAYFDKPKKFKDATKIKVYDRNLYAKELLGKRLEYAEIQWIREYVPRPVGIGEEDTVELINELIEKYEKVINEQ